jgi:periplasmic protein CpxP/Spy
MKFSLFLLAAATSLSIWTNMLPADARTGRMHNSANHSNRYEKLGIILTAEQKAKMEAIEADAKAKIDLVYTAEQRANRTAARQQKQAVQLTAEQKQKLKQLRTDYKQDLNGILTPAQQQQLAQKKGNRYGQSSQGTRSQYQGRHGHRYGGNTVESLKAKGIVLTAAQESQLTELNSKYQAARNAVYTPDQQAARQAARAKWQALNVTAEQRAQIKAIRKAAWQAKRDVLTPEQRQKLPQRWNRSAQR